MPCLAWFVQLRWLAVAGVVCAVFAARLLGFAVLPEFPTLLVAAGIGLYNLYFSWQTRRISALPAGQQEGRLSGQAHLQISLDLLALTFLVYLGGGWESPLMFAYVFHMIISSILLPRKGAFVYAIFATGLIWAVELAERSGLIPHHAPIFASAGELHAQTVYVAVFLAVFCGTLVLTVYLTSTIVELLRSRDAELVRARQQLQARTLDLQEANGKLEDLARRRTESARRVAHELRAPVGSIKSLLDVILQGYSTEPEELLRLARDAAANLLDLVNDLLAMGHIKEVGPVAQTSIVRLDDTLAEVVAVTGPEAARRSINLSVRAQGKLPPVRTNPEYARQLLVNLIDNAIKYSPPGGTVEATLRAEGRMVVGSVRDTGIGIAPDDQPHIFEEFYRAENAKQVQCSGTGLGLAIVRRIVDLYGGEIFVESTPGVGSRFTFTLPASFDEVTGGRTFPDDGKVGIVGAGLVLR